MKYIMVWPYGWFDSYMYKEVIDNGIVKPFCLNMPLKSKFVDFFRRLHHSYKINHIIDLPYKDIWYKGLLKLIDDNTCIMFDTGALSMVSCEFLKEIRQASDSVKMVVIAMDSLHGASNHIYAALPNLLEFKWDAILSYDENDCKEYGFQPLGQGVYSKLSGISPKDYESDIYYVGRDKAGRNAEVFHLYKELKSAGVVTDFNLVSAKRIKEDSQKGIRYSRKDIPYEDVVRGVLSTNCILEIAAKGQHVQTARYYEAVCYNKKLLTNNFAVKKLSFYDERYIRCFNSIEDIDMEWIKKKEPLDYHYNGEFSPIHIIKKLEKIFSKN